jgi:hypothetical protein
MSDIPLAEDLIEGADKIGAELGLNRKRTYDLLEGEELRGAAFKMGGRWFARRSTLRKHIERLESGTSA